MDTIFKILGTPPKEYWREGYDLAVKRSYAFTVHKKIPLKFLIEDVSQECLDILDRMFAINPHHRPSAGEILAMPYFKNCIIGGSGSKQPKVVTQGNLSFGITPTNREHTRLQSDDRRQPTAGEEVVNPQGFIQGRRSSMQAHRAE